MRRVLITLAAAALAGCGDSGTSYSGGHSGGGGRFDDAYEATDDREPFDEDAAREAAEEELASEGYDGSYGCTSDCSGHEAGWQWRAENGYSTYGNSQSFSEGGQAFDDALEERIEEKRAQYEAGEDPDY